ncbi:MAG: DUF357 domain-containing protein [Candidatus Nanohaloarchaea archaeon]
MNETQERLEEETEKWREKLEERLEDTGFEGEDAEGMVENAEAYLEDSRHFEEEGDMVRAFEAVVWGWAWIEIGEEVGEIKRI